MRMISDLENLVEKMVLFCLESQGSITVSRKLKDYEKSVGNKLFFILGVGRGEGRGIELHQERLEVHIRITFLVARVVVHWDRLPGQVAKSLQIFVGL